MDFDKYIRSTGTHYISNSGHDENGKYHGGKAGDQTGEEWQLRKWYNRPWSCVLRWPDQKVAQKFAEFGIEAALNNKVGYDQYQRKTYWNELEKVDSPSKIKNACEADCTEGVTANVKKVGTLMGIPKLKALAIDTYSGNMKSRFKAAGFTVLTASKYLTGVDYLLPGDVLLYEGHHAAMNITLGKKAGTWNPEKKTNVDNNSNNNDSAESFVTITGGSVNIRKEPNTSASIITVSHKGDVFKYKNKEKDGWYLIEYKGSDMWVSKKYSSLHETYIYITGGSVNVRSLSNTSGKILGVVHKNDSYKFAGESTDEWVLIYYKNSKGWVSKKYCNII